MKLKEEWVEWYEQLAPLKQFNCFMLLVIAITVMLKSVSKLLLL